MSRRYHRHSGSPRRFAYGSLPARPGSASSTKHRRHTSVSALASAAFTSVPDRQRAQLLRGRTAARDRSAVRNSERPHGTTPLVLLTDDHGRAVTPGRRESMRLRPLSSPMSGSQPTPMPGGRKLSRSASSRGLGHSRMRSPVPVGSALAVARRPDTAPARSTAEEMKAAYGWTHPALAPSAAFHASRRFGGHNLERSQTPRSRSLRANAEQPHARARSPPRSPRRAPSDMARRAWPTHSVRASGPAIMGLLRCRTRSHRPTRRISTGASRRRPSRRPQLAGNLGSPPGDRLGRAGQSTHPPLKRRVVR